MVRSGSSGDPSEAEESVFVGAHVPRALSEYLECLVLAVPDEHQSKSDVIRKALRGYVDALSPAMKEGVEKMLKARRETIEVVAADREESALNGGAQ